MSALYGIDRFLQDLSDLGYPAEKMLDADNLDYAVIRNFEVPVGRFQGRIIDLGIPIPNDYPRLVGTSIHIKAAPQLLEYTDTVANVRNIIASKLGQEWRYWSFRLEAFPENTSQNLIFKFMEYFSEYKKDICVSIPDSLNCQLLSFLLRKDGQEDLLFGLWYTSEGIERNNVLVHSILPPLKGDRKVHGNVSFNYPYFKRACDLALKNGCGIVFMHSHPFPGWQAMSSDDVKAESRMAPTVDTITNLPLLGLTVGSDGTWSGRIWSYYESNYQRKWAKSVKVIGNEFSIFLDNKQKQRFIKSEYLKRTVSVWGSTNHEILSNLTIGIVGLGSVGSIVAETLARMGMRKITLIDFDKVEKHNLDRIIGATKKDIGKYKVDVISKAIKKSSPFGNIEVIPVPKSIAKGEAYMRALDCDLLFCCADKPRARFILNHIAYSHLIPVTEVFLQRLIKINCNLLTGN